VPFVISLGAGGWGGAARGDPSRGDGLTGRPTPNLARSPVSRHHHSMASNSTSCWPTPSPSARHRGSCSVSWPP